jgi:hypothetical protein
MQEEISQGRRSPDQDLNMVSPKHEAGILTTQLSCSALEFIRMFVGEIALELKRMGLQVKREM